MSLSYKAKVLFTAGKDDLEREIDIYCGKDDEEKKFVEYLQKILRMEDVSIKSIAKTEIPPDTSCTDNPICPYCGYEDVDWGDYVRTGSYDAEVWCNVCEKEYKVRWESDIHFWTEK
jgi:hypothetical protein